MFKDGRDQSCDPVMEERNSFPCEWPEATDLLLLLKSHGYTDLRVYSRIEPRMRG